MTHPLRTAAAQSPLEGYFFPQENPSPKISDTTMWKMAALACIVVMVALGILSGSALSVFGLIPLAFCLKKIKEGNEQEGNELLQFNASFCLRPPDPFKETHKCI